MRKIIKIRESDLRRLVEKVIKEDCGGSGFVDPQESSDRLNRYNKFQEEMSEQTPPPEDETNTEETPETSTEVPADGTDKSIDGGDKYSEKDVSEVLHYRDGKKSFNALTVAQKILAELLGFVK